MKKNSIAIFLLVIALMMSGISTASASKDTEIQKAEAALGKILDYYQKRGEIQSDWEAMILAINGESVPGIYADNISKRVRKKEGTFRVATDYARTILVWKAAGGNPADVEGYNLVEKLYNFGDISCQGVNGPLWSLIALSGEDIPSDARWTRERLLEELLSFQNPDGGFPLSRGSGSDIDLTGMALIALSNLRNEQKAVSSIEKAVDYLSLAQLPSGGYECWGTENSESTSQVIIGLAACGISPGDTRFKKEGMTLVDVLLEYRDSKGLFKHILKGKADNMATEQAAEALTAVTRSGGNGGSIYNCLSGNTRTDIVTIDSKPVLDTGTADSPDSNGSVVVRAEGSDKTRLGKTPVGIVTGQTTLGQAVLAAFEKTGTPYTAGENGKGHLLESIDGEYDWQWLINGQGGMVLSDRKMKDGDSILLVDGYLWNPIPAEFLLLTGSPAKNKDFKVLLAAGGKPLEGQTVNFAGVSAVTDAQGKVEFKPDQTGTFVLSAQTTGNIIRPESIPVRVESDAVLPVDMELTLGSKTVYINGLPVESEAEPYTSGGKTMVPIRLIAENLGAVVEWDDNTCTATIVMEGREPFSLNIGTTDGFDTALEILDGLVMAPVRYVSEKLGAQVEWENPTRTVTIVKAR